MLLNIFCLLLVFSFSVYFFLKKPKLEKRDFVFGGVFIFGVIFSCVFDLIRANLNSYYDELFMLGRDTFSCVFFYYASWYFFLKNNFEIKWKKFLRIGCVVAGALLFIYATEKLVFIIKLDIPTYSLILKTKQLVR